MGRGTLHALPVVTLPSVKTMVPLPETVDVQLTQEFPLVLRPNRGEEPAVVIAPVTSRLGSSQAPLAGTNSLASARRYSAE
jgi:hypothetical protein